MSKALKLRIHLQKPPANVHYALQKGHGNKYEITHLQVSGLQYMHFELVIDIKGDRQKNDLLNLEAPNLCEEDGYQSKQFKARYFLRWRIAY